MTTIRFSEVSLRYRRAPEFALSDVTLSLTSGIIGLVGVNGAGKSSLLRLLLGSRRPTSGSITISGQEPNLFRRTHGLGFIPEKPTFPPYLTVGEFLAGLRSVVGAGKPGQFETMLAESFALFDLRNVRLSKLSLGQKRRVELAAALIGDPPLLLLDEPTNGLDPLAVAALRGAIAAYRRDGRLVVISSHHLDELQRIADRVVMLDRGRLVGSWSADEAREQVGALESRFHSLVGHDAD